MQANASMYKWFFAHTKNILVLELISTKMTNYNFEWDERIQHTDLDIFVGFEEHHKESRITNL